MDMCGCISADRPIYIYIYMYIHPNKTTHHIQSIYIYTHTLIDYLRVLKKKGGYDNLLALKLKVTSREDVANLGISRVRAHSALFQGWHARQHEMAWHSEQTEASPPPHIHTYIY